MMSLTNGNSVEEHLGKKVIGNVFFINIPERVQNRFILTIRKYFAIVRSNKQKPRTSR